MPTTLRLTALALLWAALSLTLGCGSTPLVPIELRSAEGDGVRDAALIVKRFKHLNLRAEVVAAGRRTIQLRVERDAPLGSVLPFVSAPSRFAMYELADDQRALWPSQHHIDAKRATMRDSPPPDPNAPLEPILRVHPHSPLRHDTLWYWTTRADVEALVAEAALPPGTIVAIERMDSLDRQGSVVATAWTPILLLDPPFIAGDDIAEVAVRSVDRDRPVAHVTMNDRGRKRLAQATGRLVQRYVALVLDGEIAALPVVLEAITRGAVTLNPRHARPDLPANNDGHATKAQAAALAAALSTEPLSAAWGLAKPVPTTTTP